MIDQNPDADQSQPTPSPAPQDATPAQPAPPDAPAQASPAAPQQAPSAPAPAAPAKPESKWASVVKGALAGLQLGGIPGAVMGAAAPAQARQVVANRQALQSAKVKQAQNQVQFQSIQAAKIMADTAMTNIQREQMPAELKLRQSENDQKLFQTLIDHGAQPSIVTADGGPDSFQAGLEGLNGPVPPLLTLHLGDKAVSFDLNQLGQQQSLLSEVNRAGSIMGRPSIQPAQWNNNKLTNPGAKTKLLADSLHFFNPTPESGDKLNGQIEQYKNYLAKAQMLPEGDPNKDKSVSQLKDAVDLLQKARDSREAEKIRTGKAIGASRAQDFNASKPVEVTGDNGAKFYVPFGVAFKNSMPSAKTWGDVEPLVKTANDAEKSYQMFQDAYKDFKSGTKTGAQSMLALSQHLATTFGNVKGARVTKDMIQEHLGARSISDKALVAVQKFTNGDVLSPDQWDAFKDLIGGSRRYAWATATKEANAKNISIRGLAPKDLGGQADIRNTSSGSSNRPPLSSFERK